MIIVSRLRYCAATNPYAQRRQAEGLARDHPLLETLCRPRDLPRRPRRPISPNGLTVHRTITEGNQIR